MDRSVCGGGVHEGAGPVAVERTSGDDLERPLDQGVRHRPLITFDGDQELLGQDERGHGRRLDADGDVVGVRERRVRLVEVSFEQGGQSLGVEHRGSIRAGGAQPLQGLRWSRCASRLDPRGTGSRAGRPSLPRPCSRRAGCRWRAAARPPRPTAPHRRVARAGRRSRLRGRSSPGCAPRATDDRAGPSSCSTMSTRPLAQTGCIASITRRTNRVRVTGKVGVIDGRFQIAGRLEAHRGARVQLRDRARDCPGGARRCSIWRNSGW